MIAIIVFSIILICISSHFLIYLLFGFFPSIKARALTPSEKERVLRDGISHFTTRSKADAIIKSRRIKKSSFIYSYSSHLRRSSFFFANSFMDKKALLFNAGNKDTQMEIRSLSE